MNATGSRPVLRACVLALLGLALGLAVTRQEATAQNQFQQGVDAAERAQQRGSDAIDRASTAQQRAAAAVERATSAQDRAVNAVENAAGAQQRASSASERAAGVADNPAGPAAEPRGRSPRAATFSERHEGLARANPDAIELVDRVAAVRGEVVAINPSARVIEAARQGGFTLAAEEVIEGIDLRLVTLVVPSGQSVQDALASLRAISADTRFTANHIHLQSATAELARPPAPLAPSTTIAQPAIGLIDGGVADTPFTSRVNQRGFARGAPRADSHATALASLASGIGSVNSAAPGAPLLVADIYGSDPRGGSAVALARALGWMATQRVTVVIVGLVGPSNPIVEQAVQSLHAQGILIVAPVGNAGAAAPPMYPAAYPGVVGVTGVDRRNRALAEAGRGAHVDFAAPGADIRGAALNGSLVLVRGTSYAAPLVAGQLWQMRNSSDPVSSLIAEAVDLGRQGRDQTFGHGLVCGGCR